MPYRDCPRPSWPAARPRAVGIAALLTLVALAQPVVGQDTPADPSRRDVASPTDASPHANPATPDSRRIVDAVHALEADVAKWGGTLGLAVVDASGRAIAASNEHTAMNPASNAKLVTTAAALRYLGPAHRFVTGLYGAANGGVVSELVLRGEGDPSLSSRDLRDLARDLRDTGVREIGSISVDQGYFDDRYVPPAFDEQPNEWAPFRAPVAAVSLDENTVTFTVRAAKKGANAAVTVSNPGFVDLAGLVRTTAKREAESLKVTLEPRSGRLGATIAGHVPEGAAAVELVKRVDDPRLLAGHALRSALAEVGVVIGGDVHLGGAAEKHALVVHRSAPLGELLAMLGKHSDNFYAEMIFKTLAAERKARPATADAAADIVRGFLSEIGALEDGVVFKNGSGLYGGDRTTAHAMTSLLRASYADPRLRPELVASLSIAGVDGTLRSRLKRWGSGRAIRAKTGTLASVAALSGYVLAPGGGAPIVFSILVNGIPGKVGDARGSMDRVVDAIASELWSVSAR